MSSSTNHPEVEVLTALVWLLPRELLIVINLMYRYLLRFIEHEEVITIKDAAIDYQV